MKELLRVIAVFVLVVGIGVPREMYAEEIPTNKYNIVHQIKDVFRSVLVDKPCRVRKYKDCFFFIATETELQRVHYVNGDKNNMEVEDQQKARWVKRTSNIEKTGNSKIPFYYSAEYTPSSPYPREWWSGLSSAPVSLFADDAALRMFESYYNGTTYRFSGGLGRLWYISNIDVYDTVDQEDVYDMRWDGKEYSEAFFMDDKFTGINESLSERKEDVREIWPDIKFTKEYWGIIEEYKTRAEYTASSEYREKYRTY